MLHFISKNIAQYIAQKSVEKVLHKTYFYILHKITNVLAVYWLFYCWKYCTLLHKVLTLLFQIILHRCIVCKWFLCITHDCLEFALYCFCLLHIKFSVQFFLFIGHVCLVYYTLLHFIFYAWALKSDFCTALARITLALCALLLIRSLLIFAVP